MILFEWILVLLFAAVVLTAAAERLRVPYPSLLAIAGAGIAFLPFAPDIRIEPDLGLALFGAPALLDAAFDTSPQELRRNVIPVVSLAVFAVLLTTAAVAFLGWGVAGGPTRRAAAGLSGGRRDRPRRDRRASGRGGCGRRAEGAETAATYRSGSPG